MRLFQRAALVVLVALLAWKGIIPALTAIDTDFPNYYTAARLVLNDADCARIYDGGWFGAQATALGLPSWCRFAPFPPATVFVMLPLAWLPPLTALQAWTLLNCIVLAGVIMLLRAITGRDAMWCALIVLTSGRALINNFRFGQFYLVLLLCVLLVYRGMQRDRSVAAGIALGIGAAIKYFPAIYFIPLIVRRQWRIVVWGAATGIAIAGAAMLVIGAAAQRAFVANVLLAHANGVIAGQTPYSATFESWNSLLRRLFIFDATANPTPALDFPPAYALGLIFIYLCVIAATVIAWRAARRAAAERILPLRFALLTIAALAVVPASATYHFLLLVPPVALLLAPRGGWSGAQRIVLACVAAIGYLPLGFTAAFEGRGLLSLFAYPRLYLVAVMLGSCVRVCRRASAGRPR